MQAHAAIKRRTRDWPFPSREAASRLKTAVVFVWGAEGKQWVRFTSCRGVRGRSQGEAAFERCRTFRGTARAKRRFVISAAVYPC